jgi:hypothetical protein
VILFVYAFACSDKTGEYLYKISIAKLARSLNDVLKLFFHEIMYTNIWVYPIKPKVVHAWEVLHIISILLIRIIK